MNHNFLSTYMFCGTTGRVMANLWFCEWQLLFGMLNRQRKQWPERYKNGRKGRSGRSEQEEGLEGGRFLKLWHWGHLRNRLRRKVQALSKRRKTKTAGLWKRAILDTYSVFFFFLTSGSSYRRFCLWFLTAQQGMAPSRSCPLENMAILPSQRAPQTECSHAFCSLK